MHTLACLTQFDLSKARNLLDNFKVSHTKV